MAGVGGYADAIPTPEEVLGHRIATRHTRPAELVRYFEAIGAASDRVVVRQHGVTYEGRPLIHAIVTSPRNHARLEEIRQQNLRLAHEPGSVSDAEIATMPTVVYLGYSVHGNEASGSEASPLVLYHLAAGSGPAVESVLNNTVVIIDPSINPDGRARFADWVNRNRGGVPTTDPQDREHNEPWPGGRTNHYFFDVNRDWLPVQLIESRGRLDLWHQWHPQLHTDHHEMGGDATFFFQPGVPSRDNPNTPASTVELTGRVAEYHARAMDAIGALYYTRESFDDFYYGKGSTYPDVSGAVGILFEQASSRALVAETDFGELTYPFTVRNQFMVSLSTLEAAVEMRETLLRHKRDFYGGASAVASGNPVKAYVWGGDDDRTRAQALAQMLRKHRIRVFELGRSVDQGGESFVPGQAYIVPTDQPQARLVHAMMERVTEFQDSLFYDVSAWTMPLAFGVAHAEIRGNPAGLLGAEVGDVNLDGGAVIGGEASYAYVLEWNRYFAPRALYRIQEAGIAPILLNDPFTASVAGNATELGRGAIVIPVESRAAEGPSPDEVHELMRTIAREDHVLVNALSSGLTSSGVDLGSPGGQVLEQPRIALLSGSGTNGNEVGEAWFLLSERFRLPVSLLDVAEVGGADLGRYNTIVMAGYFGGLGDAGDERLADWVRAGGALIALGNSVRWPIGQELVDATIRQAARDTMPVSYAEREARFGAQALGGAIFEAHVDVTHPLAYGYGPRVPLFRDNSIFLDPSDQPAANVAVYGDDPLLSGYISEERMAQLVGSAAIIGQGAGRGNVIMMPENPNFRAFWWGTNGLFLNAVFFGRAF
jgi:hypothetical protein